MTPIRPIALAAAVLLAVAAMPSRAATPAAPAAPAASAAATPPPMPMGARGMGGRWGAGMTPGWSMMTPAERDEHRAKMQAMTHYGDCKAYVDEHHQEMVKRAAERGAAVPAMPRRDACAGLKP